MVLERTGAAPPYADSRPLVVTALHLAPPGPGEVLLRVGAASVCHSDLSVVSGARPRPVPMLLGHEGCGVVEEVGPGVEHVRPGQAVVLSFVPSCGTCRACAAGRPALCEAADAAARAGTLLTGSRPASRDGAPVHVHLGASVFAERTVVHASSVVPVPDDLAPVDATLFGCATLTGVGAVLRTAAARPGDSAAVFGLGGVGLAAVMGAALAGCSPVVAVDRVPEKVALALEVGASHGVLAAGREPEDVVAQVRELTGGGADHAFEVVGAPAVFAQAYAATGRGGTTVAVGLPGPDAELRLPAVGLVAQERRVLGSYMGSAVPARDVPRYVALFRAGRLPVDRLRSGVLGLDGVNEAMDALAAGTAVRQVLLPGG
ncbi:zinc-binding dehydrogenase [Kineococcus glutinatus]|uniref:zinc-binding dehydrogenase n=1 Tax=Kineococcus glutinatus TaxID=1070872 RepID=UPI0031EF54DB